VTQRGWNIATAAFVALQLLLIAGLVAVMLLGDGVGPK